MKTIGRIDVNLNIFMKKKITFLNLLFSLPTVKYLLTTFLLKNFTDLIYLNSKFMRS